MHPRASRPAIGIESIRWERIQLRLDARVLPGSELTADGLLLDEVDGTGRMPPTAATIAGDHLRLRINVMQGPDLQPLAPGRWRLVSTVAGERPGEAVPILIVASDAVDPVRDGAAFRLREGVYRVTPAVAPDGSLAFDVALDEDAGFDRDLARRARARARLAGPVRGLRGILFRIVLHGLRRATGRSGRRILFSSDSRGGLEGNLKRVHDRMIARGLDRTYALQTLFRESIAHRRRLRDRFLLPWLLAGADVIVIDDFQPIIYRIGVDPDVRIVQLWHAAGAFKTVGYSRIGKPGGPDPFSRVHKNYTHAIVSSDHDVPFYAEAFGIPESRVIPTGIPRMDPFFDERARANGLAAARAAFPASEGRMTILFAPTFRGDGPRTAWYDFDRLDYAALHALAIERDAVVIIRMHPFVTTVPAIPDAYADRLIDGSATTLDVNDLLFAVDLLITDYSSIVFEFSTLGRPMLFYAYDLDDYIATRDFYEPFETFVPGRIVRSFPELLDAIRRDDFEIDKVAAFAARHFAHLDDGSTDRVIDRLVLPR
jgi:CDP-ribitol ribitolphosphotransferase / teichoic acid ribitol-phosphate polymerase